MFWNESGVHGGKGTLYKGEIEVCQVEPSCFYPDPNAFTLEDCDYIHIVGVEPASPSKSGIL